MDSAHPTAKPVFSQMLRERLIEDACLRAHVGQIHSALETAQAAAAGARGQVGIMQRIMNAVQPANKRHLPEAVIQTTAREKEIQRQTRELEQIIQGYTTDLDTLITMHLQETMPVFYEYSVARKRLGEWEGTVNALRADVRGLLKALGSARGSATSGYNKSKHTVTATAQEAFNRAAEAVRSVEARLKLANDQAQALGGLPVVAMVPSGTAIKNLPGLDIGAMQKEFERLTHELEAFETEQLANLMEPVVQEALGKEAQAKAYVENYREFLREFSDRQMQPEHMAKAIPAILARQARR